MPWRAMEPDHLPGVRGIADRVHLNYPEDEAVFSERLELYPEGCFVLERAPDGLAGYIISHPWHFKKPPALNVLLGAVAEPASTYYIHDIALLPEARSNGSASEAVLKLVRHAKKARFPNLSLVAVNNSVKFWEGHAFRTLDDADLNEKLASYDARAKYMVLELT
ncbi:GNAT family N-acetyltransferase [Bradyrhizobium yuanmingense]|uniref:GNAT family N-acetyltransferase n=1 Tax=Bradyrhizobium yuanmingense TaxID=108015 RepID=UPI000FE3D72C|nr:GNAT family N-acetyltransferase [Bradyrhizobium yuanmingense]TGN72938.1 GNAT family N-acetyltransferase [Bradyrhizobium yuanmingense]